MKTKLCSIVVVWDGHELLPFLIDSVRPHVDGIIIIWSKYSNRGKVGDFDPNQYPTCYTANIEPDLKLSSHDNERAKRNFGLDVARQLGFTHFLVQDVDEFYDADEFEMNWTRIREEDLNGLVCRIKVYFKEPTLTIGLDPVTYVPFIHKLKATTHFVLNKYYPFSYDKDGVNHIDPTRKMNYSTGVEWSDMIMHHQSYVRKDLRIKIENSSSERLKKSSLYSEWQNAKEGDFISWYGKTLEKCENKFGIAI